MEFGIIELVLLAVTLAVTGWAVRGERLLKQLSGDSQELAEKYEVLLREKRVVRHLPEPAEPTEVVVERAVEVAGEDRSDEVRDLEEKLAAAQSVAGDLRASLGIAEERYERLEVLSGRTIDELRERETELLARVEELEEVASRSNALDYLEVVAERDRLSTAYDELLEAYQELDQSHRVPEIDPEDYERLRLSSVSLEERVRELLEGKGQTEREYAQQVAALKKEAADWSRSNERVVKERDEVREKLAIMATQIEKRDILLSDAEAARENAEGKFAELRREMSRVRSDLGRAEAQVETLERAVERSESKVAGALEAAKKAEVDLKSSAASKAAEKFSKDLARELNEVAEQNMNMKKELADLRNDKARLEKELSDAVSIMDDELYEKRRAELEAKLRLAKKTVANSGRKRKVRPGR